MLYVLGSFGSFAVWWRGEYGSLKRQWLPIFVVVVVAFGTSRQLPTIAVHVYACTACRRSCSCRCRVSGVVGLNVCIFAFLMNHDKMSC